MILTGQAIPQSLRADLFIATPPEEDLLGDTRSGKPLVPVFVHTREKKLHKPPDAPVDSAVAFLRNSGFPVALVTNGEQWSVVHAPPEGVTSTATWYAEMWLEEPVTFRAFRALMGARRWFHAEANSTLPKLLERSALNQGAVTAQLGAPGAPGGGVPDPGARPGPTRTRTAAC